MDKYQKFYIRAGEHLGLPPETVQVVHEGGFINESTVNMFLCLSLYPELKSDTSKAEAVRELAAETGLSESYCRNVLGNYPYYAKSWAWDFGQTRKREADNRKKKSKSKPIQT